MFWTTGKGETQWETRAVRKTRKRVRNRALESRNKKKKRSRRSSQNEALNTKHCEVSVKRTAGR